MTSPSLWTWVTLVALALPACASRPHYYVVEYDVVHRPDVVATSGLPTVSGGVRLTHCESAVCGRLAEHVRASAASRQFTFDPDGALTFHIQDVTLFNGLSHAVHMKRLGLIGL